MLRALRASPQVVGYKSRLNSALYRESVVGKIELVAVLKKLQTAFLDRSYRPYYKQEEIDGLLHEKALKGLCTGDKPIGKYYRNLPSFSDPSLWQDLIGTLVFVARSMRGQLIRENVRSKQLEQRAKRSEYSSRLRLSLEGIKILEDWLYYNGSQLVNKLIIYLETIPW